MPRYFLQISYKGTAYRGWQVQPGNARTIQAIFNKKLSTLLRQQVHCVGCGRTDTGVHASDFFLHFDFEDKLPPAFASRMNRFLPPDIGVKALYIAEAEDAHARFSVASRTYTYKICTKKNPFIQELANTYTLPLDVVAMQEALTILPHYEDYTALCKVNDQSHPNLCKIEKAGWHYYPDHMLHFEIVANRFLRGMVRILVGSLLEVGKGSISPGEFEEIIKSKDRQKAAGAAPAQGLYLSHIHYPPGTFRLVEGNE